MELTREEESALKGEQGEIMQMAYRILVATGEATDAEKLIPIEWAHLSGVNYNTIGDAGEEFLSSISKDARVKVKTSLNPMGFDIDNVSNYNLDDNFISKQLSIKQSYENMGVIPSFSCIPYEIFDIPTGGTQVSFAESNAAIHANSFDNLKTNKESAFSALASALTGKSPYSSLRKEESSKLTIRMKVENPNELTYGMLGFFAGKVGNESVNISGIGHMDRRSCKSLCGGMGTSGTCAKFNFDEDDSESEVVDFDEKEMKEVYDQLNTAEKGDLITLGSPQLGLEEISDLTNKLKGRSFKKRCMIFCPRAVKEQATKLGHTNELERAGCEILSDCCTCLTPLIKKDEVDAVTTNSIKGAYYLKNSNGVDVNLKSLSEIIEDETK
ncbi:MAG: aconitase X catalytic domain-containing protein [Nitrosopumilaceae archaeon]|jgi:predicted aconitase|uniref:Aconitase X catalytic domain-containing protein n=2 Tax=Candidatus Nitrosomaritimum aestuariumsis TaxID=3342354 RepID=A0AC60WAS8_9ARCH|nr:aconitase X catalytic domain-containing protein [Nitrosopumilaceae archaeon]MBA4459401.1 aconitase X catalytic domain-containing protein [Nitrosopumilaceae archaeon]MBA4464088.1 aconitase X catalytic domain-containing protein [Nitrosopumilaceae archaeon]